MIPSRRLILLMLGLLALGLVVSGTSFPGPWAPAWPFARLMWAGCGAALALAAAFDGARALRGQGPRITRRLPASFPVASWSGVRLDVSWPGPGSLDAEIFDHHPGSALAEGLPARVRLRPSEAASITYRLRPVERGQAGFGRAEILVHSPWGLWRRRRWAGDPATARVYPDFRPVTRYALLAVDNRTSQLGVRIRQRRGEGLELHHLREYRLGDPMRQIDWKASSRRLRLISREYQDERNQQLVLLLDCGRSMRSLDDGEPHFDHALRSALLLAYVALRQGDAVGVMTFAGKDVWLPPVKGRSAMKTILNVVHDLETTTGAPDYLSASATLIGRQRRRSLVVIISNLRDEDGSEISDAMRLMGRRHLVVLASLRETALDDELSRPPVNFAQARRRAATHHYLGARRKAHAALRGRGLRFCDVAPRDLPVALVNRYLEIKRAGAL